MTGVSGTWRAAKRTVSPPVAAVVAVCCFLTVSMSSLASERRFQVPTIRFAVIGDAGTADANQAALASRMVERHSREPFEMVLMLGDNVYESMGAADLASEYRKAFERPYRELIERGVQFFACLGNHDDPRIRFYPPYHMGGRRYYSFTRGDAFFVALDTNRMDKAQLTWLEQQLRTSTQAWRIAFFHHPIYSSAQYHGPDLALRRQLEPLLVTYGVQVALAGHDHVYERTKPQRGVTYFVSGAGGRLREKDLRTTELTAAGFDEDRSFMVVEIQGSTLSFQVVSSRAGEIVDSGLIQSAGPAEDKKAPPFWMAPSSMLLE